MSILSMIPAIVSAGSAVYGAIANRRAAKKANQTQKELQEHSKEQQLDIWNKTNFEAQKKHMKQAGLNPGLMYGMGGAGGATTGGVATGQAAKEEPYDIGQAINRAAIAAQIEMTKAQAEKTRAETENIKGVERTGKEISNRAAEIDTQVKEKLGADQIANAASIAYDKANAEGKREIREIEAWMAEALMGATKNDEWTVDKYGTWSESPNTAIRKAKRAGLEEVVQKLVNLKKDAKKTDSVTDINEIQAEIMEFKDDLTKLGLNEQSVTIINTLLKLLFGRK